MSKTKLINRIAMVRSKKYFCKKYDADFFAAFKEKSNARLREILPAAPDIGDSVFVLNFNFCPCYIAWYKTLLELGQNNTEACENLWVMNENLMTMIPKAFRGLANKQSVDALYKKGRQHEKRSSDNTVHPYDWKIRNLKFSDNVVEYEIYECGMIKLCRDYDALGLFPAMCRMDYLMSHYLGSGFERTKTLGDGDDCCNCRLLVVGECEWAPEKGFDNRK